MKKKILHIQLLPLLSGVQKMMLQLLDHLDKEKYEIYVASKPGGPLVDKIIEKGYIYCPIPSFRRNFSPFDFLAWREIYHLCNSHNFDIVHTHSSKPGILGRFAAYLTGVPTIIHTVHGLPFNDFTPKHLSKVYQKLERYAGHLSTKIAFVNNFERELCINKGIVPYKKAITIHNGVSIPSHFKKEIYPSFEGKRVIGMSTRFAKGKNILLLLKLAKTALSKNNNIRFIFVGDGPLFSKAKDYINKYNLQDKIILPGWQNNIYDWLKYFDAFILYSQWEGLPLSILEAMSVGLPIIASDIKGCNELVNKSNGWLFDVNKPFELLKFLINFNFSNSELEKIGKNSLEKVISEFNIEQFINGYKELYK